MSNGWSSVPHPEISWVDRPTPQGRLDKRLEPLDFQQFQFSFSLHFWATQSDGQWRNGGQGYISGIYFQSVQNLAYFFALNFSPKISHPNGADASPPPLNTRLLCGWLSEYCVVWRSSCSKLNTDAGPIHNIFVRHPWIVLPYSDYSFVGPYLSSHRILATPLGLCMDAAEFQYQRTLANFNNQISCDIILRGYSVTKCQIKQYCLVYTAGCTVLCETS